MNAEDRLAEVRRRMITDFYTGTSDDSPHWWTCRVCDYSWRHGEEDSHEETCPLKDRNQKEDSDAQLPRT